MQVAVRSSLTAGVAVVGAAALLITPISPSAPPDIQVPAISSAKVELAALVNPIELWAELITTSVGNVGTLVNTVLAAPAPILGSVVGNQLITAQVLGSFVTTFGEGFVGGLGDVPPALQAAVAQILGGDIAGGVQAVAGALLAPVLAGAFGALGQLGDIAAVLQNPFLNMANVIGTVVSINTLVSLGLPLLTEALAPVFQLASTAQAVFDGVRTGNLEAVANALISFPSDMIGTILNGSLAGGNAGILSSPYGFFAGLLSLRQAIADAITPPVLTPPAPFAALTTETTPENGIASLPDMTARTLTLEAPADTVVETPKTEVEPVSTVPEEVASPATEEVVTAVEPETAAEPEAEVVTDEPADTRTNTKDGNKAVPGVVNTGVTNNGTPTTPETPTTPTEAESPTTADEPETPAGPAEATNTNTESSPSDSGAGDE